MTVVGGTQMFNRASDVIKATIVVLKIVSIKNLIFDGKWCLPEDRYLYMYSCCLS